MYEKWQLKKFENDVAKILGVRSYEVSATQTGGTIDLNDYDGDLTFATLQRVAATLGTEKLNFYRYSGSCDYSEYTPGSPATLSLHWEW